MYAVINIAYRGLCMQIVGQMPLLFVSENHVYIAALTRASKPPTRWLYEYHEASQETHLSPMHSPTHQRHPWLLKSNYIHLQLWRCENVPKKSPCLERTQSTPSTKHSIIQHLLLLSGSHASSISPVAFITTAHTTHRDDFFSVCSFAWTLPDIDWKGVRLTHRLWLATDGVCPFDNWQFIKISSFVSRLVAAGWLCPVATTPTPTDTTWEFMIAFCWGRQCAVARHSRSMRFQQINQVHSVGFVCSFDVSAPHLACGGDTESDDTDDDGSDGVTWHGRWQIMQ